MRTFHVHFDQPHERFAEFAPLCTPVDARTGGLPLSDVHELHGNAPMVGRTREWARISVVCYVRAGMVRCGTTAEELARAQRSSARR